MLQKLLEHDMIIVKQGYVLCRTSVNPTTLTPTLYNKNYQKVENESCENLNKKRNIYFLFCYLD